MPLNKHPRVLTMTGNLILSNCILALSICLHSQFKTKEIQELGPQETKSAPGHLGRPSGRLGSPTLCTSFPRRQENAVFTLLTREHNGQVGMETPTSEKLPRENLPISCQQARRSESV